jgi:hypothetical protein
LTIISKSDFVDYWPHLPKIFGDKKKINVVRKSHQDVLNILLKL